MDPRMNSCQADKRAFRVHVIEVLLYSGKNLITCTHISANVVWTKKKKSKNQKNQNSKYTKIYEIRAQTIWKFWEQKLQYIVYFFMKHILWDPSKLPGQLFSNDITFICFKQKHEINQFSYPKFRIPWALNNLKWTWF